MAYNPYANSNQQNNRDQYQYIPDSEDPYAPVDYDPVGVPSQPAARPAPVAQPMPRPVPAPQPAPVGVPSNYAYQSYNAPSGPGGYAPPQPIPQYTQPQYNQPHYSQPQYGQPQ